VGVAAPFWNGPGKRLTYEARQAEVRTDIARALLKIHEDRILFVKWVVGIGVGIVTLVFAAAGLVIAVLR